MGRSKVIPETGAAYLDELSLAATWRLLRVNKLRNVTVLEPITARQGLWRRLLYVKGIQVDEAIFFAGDLRTDQGEAVSFYASRLANQIALKAAKQIVESEPELYQLDKEYKRNTIRLFIAKQLYMHVVYWVLRALVVQALNTGGRANVWLKKPDRFDHKLFDEALSDINLCFYPTAGVDAIKLAKAWLINIVRDTVKPILVSLKDRSGCFVPPKSNRPSVLMFQENTNIRADRRLRAQPHHWLSLTDPPKEFSVYLIETSSFGIAITDADKLQLSQEGVTVLSTSIFRTAHNTMRNNSTLQRIRNKRRKIIQAVSHARGFAGRFFLLRIASLIGEAEKMAALALFLNAKVFLNREPQHSYSDAIQLVAPELNIATIAYQYSNLGFASTIMMSTADKFLIFADMYKTIYQADGISPHQFLSTGYPFDGVAGFVRDKAGKHRGQLTQAGAKFVVCYFDESVQHDRWGTVSSQDHLGELHILAKLVLDDSTFGVVVKSQYMRNSPSQLYPENDVLRAAKVTGRFLELMEGVHRNEIYPTEAALVADLCISHKFGATAGLESAIIGVRTVLLDVYGVSTLWDNIYAQADIEYKTMGSLIGAIAGLRTGDTANCALGDWSSIIHHFDPYQDGNAANRLHAVVEQCMIDTGRVY